MAKKKGVKKTKSEEKYQYLLAKGKQFSENLKKNATPWELKLYKILKDLHYNFKFQEPIICFRKHLFIVDFLLTEYNIFLEADGLSCHSSKADKKKDNRRSRYLIKEGYHPLRLWNKQISTLSKEAIDSIIKTKIKLVEELAHTKNC